MKINFGCGGDYRPGWLNIDQCNEFSPDLVMNMDRSPWPIESNAADHILLRYVLEHVGKDTSTFLEIVRELYRISKPDATIEIHVLHPRHDDFLNDPTRVRPILPEMFDGFDLATVEQRQASGQPYTPHAIHLGVDFEVIESQYFLDPHWEMKRARGQADMETIAAAARSSANVIRSIKIVLRAHKPFKPGRSLAKLTEVRVTRAGGLGDVIMALAATHAIARLSDARIVFQTSPQYRAIVAACRFVSEVVSTPEEIAVLDARFSAGGTLRDVNLDSAHFGWSRFHEVDAFLRTRLGIHVPAELKELRIEPPEAAQRRVADRLHELEPLIPGQMRVLLHPSDGDQNRTWPHEKWQELATRLRADGHQVLSIGQRGNKNKSNGGMFALSGVEELVDAFDPIETVALMDRSHLLVAADSGPIQLAGVTDIGIVGIYSVVAGRNRLPYRHGQAAWHALAISPICQHHPCYEPLPASAEFAAYRQSGPKGWFENARFLGDWCINQDRYACLLHEITVDRVMEACQQLLAASGNNSQSTGAWPPRTAGSAVSP